MGAKSSGIYYSCSHCCHPKDFLLLLSTAGSLNHADLFLFIVEAGPQMNLLNHTSVPY